MVFIPTFTFCEVNVNDLVSKITDQLRKIELIQTDDNLKRDFGEDLDDMVSLELSSKIPRKENVSVTDLRRLNGDKTTFFLIRSTVAKRNQSLFS